jgi:hypothetical protein
MDLEPCDSLYGASENCTRTEVHLDSAMSFYICARMLFFKPTKNSSMTRYVWTYSEG